MYDIARSPSVPRRREVVQLTGRSYVPLIVNLFALASAVVHYIRIRAVKRQTYISKAISLGENRGRVG